MGSVLQHFLDFATAHPSLVGLLVLLFAAAESIIIVGAIVPGSGLVIALAGIAGAAHLNVWLLTLWGTVGAIIGDGLSFWIGYRYGDQLRVMWPFRGRPGLLDRGAAFFQRHGAKSVFFARFMPGIRAVVPVAAGMLGMTRIRFYPANAASAVVWAASHILPAAGVGVAFVVLGNMSGRLALLAGTVLGIILVLFALTRLIIRRVVPLAGLAYEVGIAQLAARPERFSQWLARRLDPSQPRLAAIALWSTILALAGIGFLSVLEDLVPGAPLVRSDTAIDHLVQSLRTPFADTLMASITSLADTVVLGGLAVIVVAWLIGRRAYATAASVAFMMATTSAFVLAVKAVLERARPVELDTGVDSFAFPSGHTTLATVLFGIIAILVSRALPRSAQIAIVTIAGVGAGVIGLSRLYLSAHWASDVLGGFCFGVAMAAAFALVVEHLPAEKVGRLGLAVAALATFVLLGAWHVPRSYAQTVALYSQRPTPIAFDLAAWRSEGWRRLPASRIDLGGEIEEPVILQWAGTPDQLATLLRTHGWQDARAWSVQSAVQFLNPVVSLAELPPLALMNDGRFPALTMIVAAAPDGERRVIFRAWPTQARVIDGDHAAMLYVGSFTTEDLTHPFGMFSALRDRGLPVQQATPLVAALRAALPVDDLAPAAGGDRARPLLATPKEGGPAAAEALDTGSPS